MHAGPRMANCQASPRNLLTDSMNILIDTRVAHDAQEDVVRWADDESFSLPTHRI